MPALIDWAKRYLALGFHPIPARAKSKIPMVEWKQYQEKAPTEAELESWFGNEDGRNIALVLGRGVFAVDLDGPKAGDLLRDAGVELPVEAPTSKTGKGFHVLLRHASPLGDPVAILRRIDNGIKSQVDIRGKGIIIAPPSVHENGHKYEWIIPPSDKIPEASLVLVDLVKRRKIETPPERDNVNWISSSIQGVAEGERNATCARLSGFLLGKGLERGIVKALLRPFAAGCKPEMPMQEMEAVVDSIWRKDSTEGRARMVSASPIKDVLTELWESLYKKPERKIATGFDRLDWFLCGGMMNGELAYLGARPGVGKTAFALQICANAAKNGAKCLMVSREMPAIAIARRMLSQTGRIDASSLRRYFKMEDIRERVLDSLDALAKLPIWITDEAATLADVSGAIDNLGEVDFLVVDHLQLIRVDRGQDRRHQVEAVSRGLKVLALEHRIPVLCMSTLSRSADKGDQRPRLDSLRESGELEHDADIVLLLHRPFKSNEAEVIVAKNRDGHVGSADMEFEGGFLTFTLAQEKALGSNKATGEML